jgi:uncharacterized protein (DUF488 family)
MLALKVFTLGHSTRTVNQLITLLEAHSVNILADVRSFPRSQTNPQFNQNVIAPDLGNRQIQYAWLQKLGGRRKGFGKESKNFCWKNLSFRNYADYMESSSFKEGAEELVSLMKQGTVAIMCAEAVYWRCHRSMISDYLKSKGFQVIHIVDEKHVQEHEYTQCAKVRNGELTYHA